ncbi:MAG: BatA domain-containing protein, partial [Pirellulaceae bacterium]
MQFANFGLLLGGLLIAIPIVLHLVMRQQPKPFEFPALRFVQRRNVQNQRKLQLKHWILLLLRCLVIALLVLALARPGVASAAMGNWIAVGGLGLLGIICGLIALASLLAGDRKLLAYVLAGLAAIMLFTSGGIAAVTLGSEEASFLADQEAPVAAVLVFDTSPRMLYRHQNQTRLERAQEIAEWLIGQFPGDSEVAVIDQRSSGSLFANDVGAARQAVQRLESSVGGESLAELIPRAVQLAEGNELTRKEIYIFSDLARPAWEEQGISQVQSALAEAARIPAYLINVGVDDPQNAAIADLALSQESISENSEIILQAEISSDGVASSRTVELMLETQDDTLPRVEDGELITPEASRRNRQTIELEPGESKMVNFRLGGLAPGIHHGWVT